MSDAGANENNPDCYPRGCIICGAVFFAELGEIVCSPECDKTETARLHALWEGVQKWLESQQQPAMVFRDEDGIYLLERFLENTNLFPPYMGALIIERRRKAT